MTEQLRELLTAYVDGRLAPADQAVVEQMMQQSAEARELLQQLQGDAQALRQLPRKPIPVDQSHRCYPTTRTGPGSRAAALRQRWRSTRFLQVAAVVFVVVGLGLAALLIRNNLARREKSINSRQEPVVAQNGPRAKSGESSSSTKPERKLPAPAPSPYDLSPQEMALAWTDLKAFLSNITKLTDSPLRSMQALAFEKWADRGETVPGESILTSPLTGQGNPFKSIEYKLPTLLELAELKSTETAKLFKPGAIHYVDISAQDTYQALTTLQTGFRKTGLPLHTDQELTQRQTRRLSATVMIYVENVTVEQVQKLLQNLAKENGPPSDPVLKSLLLQTLDEKGIKWLAGILGIQPLSLLPHDAEQQKMLGIDPTKPISDETLKALLKLSAGQGRGKPAPTVGLALAVGAPRLSSVSKELRSVMEQRQGLQPGKVSLVLFVRAAK